MKTQTTVQHKKIISFKMNSVFECKVTLSVSMTSLFRFIIHEMYISWHSLNYEPPSLSIQMGFLQQWVSCHLHKITKNKCNFDLWTHLTTLILAFIFKSRFYYYRSLKLRFKGQTFKSNFEMASKLQFNDKVVCRMSGKEI